MESLHVNHYRQKRIVNWLFNEKWYNRVKLAKIILDYKLGIAYECSPLFRYLFNENSTVFDIGANMGQYACRLNKSINGRGRIYSFEPVAANFNALRIMKKMLKLNNVIPHKLGISNFAGKATINVPVLEGNLAAGALASLLEYENNIKCHNESIKVTTIDAFVAEYTIENIDFIKCDTERNENKVLQGRTANNCRIPSYTPFGDVL
jgi:FkbM family methyltransferase